MPSKKCENCNKDFSLEKSEDRIVLESKNKKNKKGLIRKYFCKKECFLEYLKKSGL